MANFPMHLMGKRWKTMIGMEAKLSFFIWLPSIICKN